MKWASTEVLLSKCVDAVSVGVIAKRFWSLVVLSPIRTTSSNPAE